MADTEIKWGDPCPNCGGKLKFYRPTGSLWCEGCPWDNAPPQPGKWQPIETAPELKDVLVIWHGHGYTDSVGIAFKSDDGDWISSEIGTVWMEAPSHWQPVPEPPE